MSLPQPSYDPDFLLAESCLAGGPHAVAELQALIVEKVTPFVVKSGVPSKEAADLLVELLGDLVVGTGVRPPLLQKYTGQCALSTWVARVGINRWLDQTRRSKKNPVLPTPEFSETPAEPVPSALHPDEEPLVEIMRESIRAAFASRPPEDFVLFRLLHEQGLFQTELASMFGFDRRTVARHADRIAAELRSGIMAEVAQRLPDMRLEWDEVMELCRAAGSDIWGDE